MKRNVILTTLLIALALLIGFRTESALATVDILGTNGFTLTPTAGGSGNTLAAEVFFSINASNQLVVTITNTGLLGTSLGGGQVLTAFMFDAMIGGQEISLTPVSAMLTSGSMILNPNTAAGEYSNTANVGGSWGYFTDSSGYLTTGGPVDAITSTGANGLFSGNPKTSPPLFSTTSYSPAATLDGPNFGLVPSDIASSCGTVNGQPVCTTTTGSGFSPLAQDSITFTLSGLPDFGDLVLSDFIFFYGTGTCTGEDGNSKDCFTGIPIELGLQPVPEAGSVALLGFGLAALTAFLAIRQRWTEVEN